MRLLRDRSRRRLLLLLVALIISAIACRLEEGRIYIYDRPHDQLYIERVHGSGPNIHGE